jgi:V/A-type H+-transporting ATPase subunit E
MTEELEKANERIQAICEKIRMETLKPAQEQAKEIIEQAKKEAEQIRQQMQQEAKRAAEELKKSLEAEKLRFLASLEQSGKQVFELLKQKIEHALFNPALSQWVEEQLGTVDQQAKLIEVLIAAIRKEGTSTNIRALIAKHFSPDEINARLGKQILETLKNHSVELGDIEGGVQIRLVDKNVMIDLSKKVLEELLASFVRKDFRKLIFT